MKYISIIGILAVIGLGGYYTVSSMNTGSMQASNTTDVMDTSVLGVLDAAEEAKEQLEGTQELERSLEDNGGEMMDDTKEEALQDNQENMMTSDETQATQEKMNTRTMLVAGGCFWCVESDLEKVPGVIEVVSGYADGTSKNPTYQNYIAGGHREVAEVTFNPSVVSFEEILIATIKHTDPTDDDGSFADRGDYYSTALYYETDTQKKVIDDLIAEIDEFGPYDAPLAIDVMKRPKFWPAEEYHQDYYKKGFSKLKYTYYRNASGRNEFIKKYWPEDTSPSLSWRKTVSSGGVWEDFEKPDDTELMSLLTDIQYKVTQKKGTERAFKNEYLDNKADGIYVDIVSGEPLFSSTNKFDSGTGWPSFTRPIEYSMVTERDDYVLLQKRTEIRSAIADSHLGHVFNDAPKELGGIRYCMNSASLRFVPKEQMETEGYSDFLYLFET